jgi:hypothetical protein
LKSRTLYLYREETARHIRLFKKLRIKITKLLTCLTFLLSAEITTPYHVSYSSFTTSTLELPIESINAPVMPYSGRGYITTDSSYLSVCEDGTDRVFRNIGIQNSPHVFGPKVHSHMLYSESD